MLGSQRGRGGLNDGTVHRHLGPLVRLGLPVLVVPAGYTEIKPGAVAVKVTSAGASAPT